MAELQTYDEKEFIQREFDELLQLCLDSGINGDNLELVKKAFNIANEAHKGIKRRSGEPYIIHPIAVAKIVVQEIGLGHKSICAALMHDVVEDTDFTIEMVQKLFGDKIAYIVDGLTKIEGVFDNTTSDQAENFKRILFTLSDDIRVIIIKIADRLHNMRTLASMPAEKQQKIASETLYLFAPLAYRLGFFSIKSELEDLSFKYLLPKEFKELEETIAKTEAGRKDFFEKFTTPIIQRLNESRIKFDISARTKSIYSIWKKMQSKDIPFEEVYDLFAVRIIFEANDVVPERSQCWHIYSIITEFYRAKTERQRDWINTPKVNGYEALHCTVMAFGTWVEVQIRTTRMEEIAEHGVAAHWRYKDDEAQQNELDKWLVHIQDLLSNHDINAIEFLDQFRTNFFSSEINIFTPKGKTITLPKGCTAIDFAYTIHSKIGDTAIAAKINHKLVPLSEKLKNGDLVEIITADNAKPQREWLSFALLTKTKSKIESALKAEVENHIERGRKIIENKLSEYNIKLQARVLNKLRIAYGARTKRELYSKVGSGIIELADFEKQLKKNAQEKQVSYWGFGLIKKIIPGGNKKVEDIEDENVKEDENIKDDVADNNIENIVEEIVGKPIIDKKKTYLLQENAVEKTLTYKTEDCCKPIPGDNIIGFMKDDGTVVVHRNQCPKATKLAAEHGDRIIKVKWATHKVLSSLARISLRGIDRIGILNELTQIITGEMSVNMRKLSVESHDGIFEGVIELYVHNTKDLNNLLTKISKIKGVEKVTRIE